MLAQLALKALFLCQQLVKLVALARVVPRGHHVQLGRERAYLPMQAKTSLVLYERANFGDHGFDCTAATTSLRSLIELFSAACAF